MPTTTKDSTAASGRVQLIITIPVEQSVLSTLSVLDLTEAHQPNDGFAEIGVMSGGTTLQNRVALLASGYTGKATLVSWTGKIITESDMFVYALVYSSDGGLFRLVGVVNPYKIAADGGIILDP